MAIKPAIIHAFCVTPCTKADIRALDSAITNTIKRAYGLPPSAPTSMVHEDIDAFGMGCESLAAAYAHRNAVALTESLRDKGRVGINSCRRWASSQTPTSKQSTACVQGSWLSCTPAAWNCVMMDSPCLT